MSFTFEEVLEEFVEASRLGRRNENNRVNRYLDALWFYEIGFKTLRTAPTPIVPVTVQTFACARCGATCERREGSKATVHLTKSNSCGGRRAA